MRWFFSVSWGGLQSVNTKNNLDGLIKLGVSGGKNHIVFNNSSFSMETIDSPSTEHLSYSLLEKYIEEEINPVSNRVICRGGVHNIVQVWP